MPTYEGLSPQVFVQALEQDITLIYSVSKTDYLLSACSAKHFMYISAST